jgi:pimeloyl-ACP methyl ester carboxylesterase
MAGLASRGLGGRSWGRFLVIAVALATTLAIATLAGFRIGAALRETGRAADLAPPGGRFVETKGGRLFVQEKGPGTGPAVVLIHGTGAWSELWRATIDHLAGQGFRVVAIDMPPFGFSERPSVPSYGRGDQARRIAGVLDGLGIDGAYLVGHSFGAGPTVETVLRFPHKVRGLVLVAGALGLSQSATASGRPALLSWLLDRPWLRDTLVAATGTNPLATRWLLSSMLYRKDRSDRRAVEILQRPMTLANSTHDMGLWLEHFLTAPPDGTALSSDRRRYADIAVSSALIWGDRDSLTPLDQGRDLHALLPGSTLLVMPEVGHIPQLEEPDAFNSHLTAVLRNMLR